MQLRHVAGDGGISSADYRALMNHDHRPLADKTVAFGEIGLSGEIRPVPNGEERLKEAATHGFRRAIVPAANAPRKGRVGELEVISVERLADALAAAF